ncbi:uncharacterized protein LOC116027503 isoform X3 [Ipomoea triloba]|uniref:uncharacterized protein LOC116027503 isoform X3 n=1 Tax=Ipomoea triloba TaxID=35885 RepID=UPI00125E7074|nr:uncharacterized protein LOC116027503 isoform X3 [Ipomoea triloba]
MWRHCCCSPHLKDSAMVLRFSTLRRCEQLTLSLLLGLVLRAATVDHILPLNFITVTMGSAALLLIGWRTLLLSILPDDQKKKNDVYKRDTPFELFEMSHNSTRRYHDDLTFHHRDRRREEISILEPSAENLKVPPSLSLLQRDRPNSLGMSNGYIEQPNIIRTPTFTPEWQMQVPHSPESIESPLDGPSGGKELIIPVEKNGFYPAKSNRAVMVCIKKYFTKAVKTYREASPELKEVWFNEFRKRYTWREEHNDDIRCNFDAKASLNLSMTFSRIRKARLKNKPPPKWISPEIYKDLEKLWDQEFDDTMNEPSKVPFERSRELITPVGEDGFYPAKANRAIMRCIKKHFTKAVKSYRKAPPELKEVWFDEFKKRYTWREEHNTNIRRIFDAKASNQLRNTLTDIRKSWRMNKPPPKWISPEIYKDLKKLWDEDFSDIRSEPSKVIFVQGRELITPVGEKGFYPAKANRAIMGCIMKHFTKAVKSYREAPPELKEVWFNEFKKTYIWREEHNTNIRRNFDAKASNQLRNTLTGIRKARRMNKPPPKCISPQVYKDLEQLWDDPEYITKCEILKQALNTVHVDDRPSSLYTDGSIPMSKRGQELITLDGKGGFHPAKVNGAIMGCIKKHFTKAVETYREVPPELKEVWFNEFRKMYIWKEEDETNIRRTFDAKASNQLLNNLIHIRKRRLENKSPPKWISLEIYKELEQLWDDYR